MHKPGTVKQDVDGAELVRERRDRDAIANIAVATSYKSKDRNTGEQKELTEWHRISFFGRLAESAEEFDGGPTERIDEVRRNAQARESGMGPV